MKKFIIIFGAISIIFLMVSHATAVPQVNSKPIMKNVSNYEKQVTLITERLKIFFSKVYDINLETYNIQSKGIIQTIINILTFLIKAVYQLIEFIRDFMQIGALILSLINAFKALIDVIIDLIEWFQNLFNPENNIVIQ